jgi:hypothetical protein
LLKKPLVSGAGAVASLPEDCVSTWIPADDRAVPEAAPENVLDVVRPVRLGGRPNAGPA